MGMDRLTHKLAVIQYADVAGSSRLVRQDEHLARERIQNSFVPAISSRSTGKKKLSKLNMKICLFPRFCSGLIVALYISGSPVIADSYDVPRGREGQLPEKNQQFMPYAFYNDTTKTAVAGAFVAQGYIQPQVDIVLNGFYSANDTSNLFYLAKDIQMPFNERIFLDAYGFFAEWGEIESYRVGNPDFIDERAGSNDSDKNNFLESEGSDDMLRLDFRYLLPIGHGEKKVIHEYVVERNGLLVRGSESGGESWNPLTSGRTFFQFEFLNREQDLEDPETGDTQLNTTAIALGLEYDNTDYWSNPSYGSRQRVAVTHDWGSNEEDGEEWTMIELEYSKFFNLGQSESAYQRVLAFNAWWIDTPTWDDSSFHDGNEVFHRPPVYLGATLGGLDRQRAYPAARFNDRSAVNYVAEYRHMNKWNPFPGIPVINNLHIPWWQWLVFAELGRVHDEWDTDELHNDMKWSLGAGARIMVEGVIVRVDFATSEEQSEVQMFIGQTF